MSIALPSANNPISRQLAPTPSNFFGIAPWFTVPPNVGLGLGNPGWPVVINSVGGITATDPLGRQFDCKTNQALELVFQTLLPCW